VKQVLLQGTFTPLVYAHAGRTKLNPTHIEKGYLQVVLDDYAVEPMKIHALYPHRKYLSAKVRTFLVFLEEWLKTRSAVRE
jgi:DNA-binding transcriptional LysR family regulator